MKIPDCYKGILRLWTPAGLVITIIVIRQSPQIRAVNADDVDFTTVVISEMIEVRRENDPLAIR
jgi:hypothetical protein